MIRMQIFMLRLSRMRDIFNLIILVLKSNKIVLITEFIYYKFEIIFFIIY
jgi:hypothetical protein